MAENKEHDPVRYQEPDLSNPANRHESSDVDIRAITKFGVALTLLCILTFAFLIGVFRYFLAREAAVQLDRPGTVDARRRPPEPRLQATPIPDLKSIRAAEDAILNSYAWVEPGKGVVRIPITQAIDLLAQRGLPSRPAASAQPPTSGVALPTDASLGPKMQQPGGPLADELRTAAAAQPPEVANPAGEPVAPAKQEKKH